MLTIRAAQMEHFEKNANAVLANQLADFLVERHPAAVEALTRDVLLQRVHWGIGLALRYHFENGPEVALFVVYLFTEGPGFHSHPSVQEILQGTNDRIGSLLDLPSDTWESIRVRGQAGRWPGES